MKSFAWTRSHRLPATRPSSTAPRGTITQRARVREALSTPRLQPKLEIGPSNDVHEREADRVADAVMRMPDRDGDRIQRACPACEAELQRQPIEEEEEELQAKPAAGGARSEVTPTVESSIQGVRQSGGRPMTEQTRAFFEPRFGNDFSAVRFHTDARAQRAAAAVNARAFTLGRDVVFGAGQYAPGSDAGRRLIAHELTHTLQQSGID